MCLYFFLISAEANVLYSPNKLTHLIKTESLLINFEISILLINEIIPEL